MDAIDAAIAVLGQPVSSIQVAAQARRDYALSQAELSAVTRQLPTRVDPIAISDSGVPMMLPALVPLIRIPHGPAAKWCWRHVDGRLEEWTEDRALAYLAAGLESHLCKTGCSKTTNFSFKNACFIVAALSTRMTSGG